MSKIGILAFILALGALGGGAFAFKLLRQQQGEIDELRAQVVQVAPNLEKFKGAVREISHELTSLVLEEIDLTKPGWQTIGKGFYVIDLAATADPKGVLLRGKIINTTSLLHEGLVFRARVDSAAAPFKVEKAAPGMAIPFEVVIPVPATNGVVPTRGFVTLDSSTISFASSTSKAPTPRDPVDPDKLLR